MHECCAERALLVARRAAPYFSTRHHIRRAAMPELSVVAPLYNESQNVQPLVDWILEALAGHAEILRGDPGRRREPGRHLGAHRTRRLGASGGPRAPAGSKRGTDRRHDGGLRPRPRPGGGEPRWRPAERPARHPDAGGQAGRGVRPGMRLAPAPAGQADPAQGAVVGGQPNIRRLTGVQITDNGCSLKAYRRDLLDRISLYAEQHRFIPPCRPAWARASPSCPYGTTRAASARASTGSAAR